MSCLAVRGLEIWLMRRLGPGTMWALTLMLAIPAWGAPPAPRDNHAQAVFAAVRASVLQVRTLLKGSQSQNAIGSGFVVSGDGLVLSNYHVVSRRALEPEAYALEYVDSAGARGPLELLAVDVRHDLALLRRAGSGLPHLSLQPTVAARGQALYSLGNPNDLGLVIVEGVNNGLREHSFYDSLHFTGAINPGMSGGPVVDRRGAVHGINVATMGESRGFLVPVAQARLLLQRWRAGASPPVSGSLHAEVARQLREHSGALAQRIASRPLPVQDDGGYAVPDAADPYMRCWANKSERLKQFYDFRSYSCSGSSELYVGQDIEAGAVLFDSQRYEGEALDPLRFAQLVQRAYGQGSGFSADLKQYGRFACTDSVLQLPGMPVKAALCQRAYLKFEGLYDFHLIVASLRPERSALIGRLRLQGLTQEDGMRIVRRYLEALRWKG